MALVYGTANADLLDATDGITEGTDSIFGLNGNDTILALGGNDYITGGNGADAIDGGAGNDVARYDDSLVGVVVSLETGKGYEGTAEGDTLTGIENVLGSSFDDSLSGNAGDNILTGMLGNDTLKGGGGADLLYGDDGNDVLTGGSGADLLSGGIGIDTADYSTSDAAVVVSLGAPSASGGHAEGDVLSSIEDVLGSAHHDTLWGSNEANVLQGLSGNDSLKGFGGDDGLNGGPGADDLNGGAGDDTMVGAGGSDEYYVDSIGDVVTEFAGQGHDRVFSTVALGLAAHVEDLTLQGSGDLNAVGNGLGNLITGNSGNNGIDGAGGADSLTGGAGNDAFIFGPGQAHGDTVVDFTGNGGSAGDTLLFSGYGPGATFTQIDATQWQVNYNGGASHDVITFLNGAGNTIHPSDYAFV